MSTPLLTKTNNHNHLKPKIRNAAQDVTYIWNWGDFAKNSKFWHLYIEDDADAQSGDAAENDDYDEGDAKAEYVKKEYFARPYECLTGALDEVEQSIIRESRPKLQMRISRPRREYGQDGFNFADKEA